MTEIEIKSEKKDGYIETKLGLIPKDWDVKKLGKLFDFKNGINAGKDAYGQGVKFVNVMDVFGNTFISHENIIGSVSISEKQLEKNLIRQGDVLFNRTSEIRDEIGMTALYNDNEKAVFGGFVIRGRPKSDNLLPEFSAYGFQLESVRRQIIAKGQGAVRVNIGQGDLEQVYYPIPPKKEQADIVAVISSWDEAISKTDKLIQAKKRVKKGLMQRLLSGKVRFPDFEGEDWVEVKLKKFFKPFSDKNKDNEDLPILSCSKVHGITLQSNIFNKRVASMDIKRYKVVERDDLIYDPMLLWDASIGFLKEVDRGVISPAYNTFKFKNGSGFRPFFEYLFDTHYMRYNYKAISQGTNRRRRKAPAEAFLKIVVNVPSSIEEQKKIAEALSSLSQEIDLLKDQIELLKKQKKGLMQQLLTGKKRVNKLEGV